MVEQCSLQNQRRLPLLLPGSDNAPLRRPKGREIASRYSSLSTSSSSCSNSSNTTSSYIDASGACGCGVSSRSSESPVPGCDAAMTTPSSSVKERAMSAERRRPTATTAQVNAERIRTSMRSLSVSFQGEWFSLPVSKVKPPPTPAGTLGVLRKSTPERRTAGATPVKERRERYRENSRPNDQPQQRWPGRLRVEHSTFLAPSLDDEGSDGEKLSSSWAALRESRKSIADNIVKDERDNGKIRPNCQETGSSLGLQLNLYGESVLLKHTSHEIVDPSPPVSNTAANRITGPWKPNVAKKILTDGPLSSPRSWSLSPRLGGVRTASPSKVLSSLTGAMLRGLTPPTRVRSVEGHSMNEINQCSSTPSMLSFAADVRRGKFGENQIDKAHDLRLLYNRQLQWRLANARVENALLVQRHTAERSMYNAWVSTSRLWRSVKSKRIELQLSSHNLKLYYILKEQEQHLEDWGLLDRDHINSLSGAIVALEACTIRIPVAGGTRVDIQKVQGAMSSALYRMQTMTSSIQSSSAEMEQMSLLVSELSNLSERERGLVDECRDILSTFIPLQMACCSLMTHALQVQQVATGKTTG